MGRLVVRIITNTKSQQNANIGIGWNDTYKALSLFSTAGLNYLIYFVVHGTQILEMVIFMDISAVSEPILIK